MKKQMKIRSIHTKLAIVVGIIITTIIAVSVVSLITMSSNELEHSTLNGFVSNVKGAAESIHGLIEAEQKELYLYENDPYVDKALKMAMLQQQDSEEFKALQQNLTSTMKAYNGKKEQEQRTHIIDINGNIIASSSPDSIGISFKDRDYFKRTKETKLPSTIDVTQSKVTGKLVTGATRPIFDENENVIGIVTISINVEDFADGIENFSKDGFYNYVIDNKGTIVYHPNEELVNTSVDIQVINETLRDPSDINGTLKYDYEGKEKLVAYSKIEDLGWLTVSGGNVEEVLAPVKKVSSTITIISIVIGVIGMGIMIFVSSKLLKPIKELRNNSKNIAQGDLRSKINNIKSEDEIGELAKDFNVMVDNLSLLIGNVSVAMEKIDSSSVNLSAITEEIAASNAEIKNSMEEISRDTSKQASDVQVTSEKTKNLGDKIERLNSNNKVMGDKSKNVINAIENSDTKIKFLKNSNEQTMKGFKEVQQTVGELIDEMKNISDIVITINNISEQTNLLSLNASIEAARVGEMGKGFAVVANEIQKLSEQTKGATKNIASIIGGIDTLVEKTKKSFTETYEQSEAQIGAYLEMDNSIADMKTALDSMIDITKLINNEIIDIEKNKNEVIEATSGIAVVSQEIAALSEEVTASSEEQIQAFDTVTQSSEELVALSQNLKDTIDMFKVK